VREKLSEVLFRTGRYATAITVLQPAAAAYRAAGDWADLARVTVWIARSLYARGTPQEGIARLMELLALLERSGASAASPAVFAALSQLLFTARQYDECLATSQRAAELARAGGDERTRLRATMLASWSRVHLLQSQGRLGEALRRLGEEVLPLVEALGDLEGLVMVHRDLAYAHALRGAVATAGEHLARALTFAEQLGDPGQLAFTLALRGWLAVVSGDWAGARADLERPVRPIAARGVCPDPAGAPVPGRGGSGDRRHLCLGRAGPGGPPRRPPGPALGIHGRGRARRPGGTPRGGQRATACAARWPRPGGE
jgi:tetratricopeptide (TPR) repeat protein